MNAVDVLNSVSPFRNLPDTERAELLSRVEIRTLRKRRALWAEGKRESVFAYVVSGALKRVSSGDGVRDTILDVVLPGDLVCGCSLAERDALCCQAVALEDSTTVAVFAADAIYALLERRPELVRSVFEDLVSCNGRMCRRVEEVTSGQVERRIATLMVRLATRVGQPTQEGALSIPVALSRQDLADLCGTTVETAIRVMSRLNRDGVVRTVKNGFCAASMDALNQLTRPNAPRNSAR